MLTEGQALGLGETEIIRTHEDQEPLTEVQELAWPAARGPPLIAPAGRASFSTALGSSDLCYLDLEGQTIGDVLWRQGHAPTVPALPHLGEPHSGTRFLIIIPPCVS